MKINRKQFQRALLLASKVLDKKSVVPVLASVRLTMDGGLKVYATNLDQSFETHVEAEGKPFDVRVDGKLLSTIVSKISDDEIVVEVDKSLTIKRKSGDVSLRLVKDTDAPQEVNFDVPISATFKADVLKDTFLATLCGTAEDKVLQGFRNVIQFTFDKGFKCTSTDEKRIVVVTGDADVSLKDELLVPIYAVRTILGSDIGNVSLGQDANHIICLGDGVKYAFRKMSVKYPNVQAFFNTVKFDRKCTVDADVFRDALELVNTMADPRLRSAVWNLTDGAITLSTKSAESGEITEKVDVAGDLGDVLTKYSLDFTAPIFRQLYGDAEIAFAQTDDRDREGNIIHTYPMQITHKSSVTSSFVVQSMRF